MNQAMTVLLIGVAGAIGALTRFGVITVSRQWFGYGFPVGTLIVNVVGCFAIGLIAHLSASQVPDQWKLVIGVGFLGALTTFSTFGVDTFTKLNEGEIFQAFLNIVLNMILGLGAVYLGFTAAKMLSAPAAG